VSLVNRFKGYLGFAVWFVGLGYVALWPLAASGYGGTLFGASLLCGGSDTHLFGANVLAMLCHVKHPLTLPPTLHVMGFSATIVAGLRFIYRTLYRYRRARAVAMAAPSVELPTAMVRRQPPLRLPRRFPPRRHFGLRSAEAATKAEDMA
jgi:hypothetical protein